MNRHPSCHAGRAGASHQYEVEALLRLESVRCVTDALLSGMWEPSTGIVDELGNLLAAVSVDIQRARGQAALMALRRGA